MTTPRFDVLAVGNALVDVLAQVDDAFLADQGVVKGTMALIDADRAVALYEAMPPGELASGGSAGNTVAGVASLGGTAAFVGKVRDDELGGVFAHDLDAIGVHYAARPVAEGQPTGRCLILITPDGERTMNTMLGISSSLGAGLVDQAVVADAAVTYLEGYLWDEEAAKDAFRAASRYAHDAGRLVSLSLSDPFCVDRHRAEFRALVEAGDVDLLFANELEVTALFDVATVDEALDALEALGRRAAVTLGAAGSVVLDSDGSIVRVPAVPVDAVVDTTGAGDLYAAGFLFGLTRGADPTRCAEIGAIAAAEVISHVGPRPLVSLAGLLG